MAALPSLAPDEAARAPTWRAAWSDRTALLMAKFAELAYVDIPSGGLVVLKAALAAGGFRLAGVFARSGVQGFLAIADGEMAVLAFRGTANLADWKYDLDASLTPLPDVPGAWIHAGFWSAFRAVLPGARALVDQIPADLGLYVTGHSLGGALAQIAAAVFERDNLAACYTFGSPRVATAAFDARVKCPHYRVVDNWDLVPGVPPPVGGYRHAGDPRLLRGPAPAAALRRDRDLIPRFLVDLWSLLVWPFTRRLSSIDDHMIWNYRARLEAIAQARNPPPAGGEQES